MAQFICINAIVSCALQVTTWEVPYLFAWRKVYVDDNNTVVESPEDDEWDDQPWTGEVAGCSAVLGGYSVTRDVRHSSFACQLKGSKWHSTLPLSAHRMNRSPTSLTAPLPR